MHKIQRILLACFFLVFTCLFYLPVSQSHAEMIDRIIAIVNDDVITFSDLNREGASLFRRITQQAPPDQVDMALLQAQEELLTSLIDKLIVEQRASKMGVSVSDAEVSNAVERVIARNNITADVFWQNLQRMGTSKEDYRNVLKNQILQQKLVSYELRSKVVIPEAKIKEYYEQHYAQKRTSESFHILQMGFTWSSDGEISKEDARKKADEVRAKAEAGQDFRALARQFSSLPSASDGGDIGVFKKDEMAGYMKSAILTLQPGQLSKVVETDAGFQFFKLLSDKGHIKNQASFEAVKSEIHERLYEEEMNSKFEKWVKDLRDQAYIKKML